MRDLMKIIPRGAKNCAYIRQFVPSNFIIVPEIVPNAGMGFCLQGCHVKIHIGFTKKQCTQYWKASKIWKIVGISGTALFFRYSLTFLFVGRPNRPLHLTVGARVRKNSMRGIYVVRVINTDAARKRKGLPQDLKLRKE